MTSTAPSHSEDIDVNAVPRQKADYQLEQLDDEILLYHPNEEKIVYLNQTGSLIWAMCDGNRNVYQIIELLSQAYPESSESIPGDVKTALGQFVKAGCIELQNGTVS